MHGVVHARRGAIVLEVMCALALMTLTLGLVATLLIRYRNAQDYFLTRRAAQLAAEGAIERFRAGEPPTPGPMMLGTGRPDGSAVVDIEPGTGDWAGLNRVTVTVTLRTRRRLVTAAITTYMEPMKSHAAAPSDALGGANERSGAP